MGALKQSQNSVNICNRFYFNPKMTGTWPLGVSNLYFICPRTALKLGTVPREKGLFISNNFFDLIMLHLHFPVAVSLGIRLRQVTNELSFFHVIYSKAFFFWKCNQTVRRIYIIIFLKKHFTRFNPRSIHFEKTINVLQHLFLFGKFICWLHGAIVKKINS